MSWLDEPFGYITPRNATGGGGGTTIGSGTFKYTAADGNDCRFTQDVELNRITLQPNTSFTQSVGTPLIKLLADTSFTMDAEADMRLLTDTAFEHSVSRVQIDPSEMLASKDSYVDATVGCVGGGTNHDGADLQCEGIVATRKDPIFGWDVTGFPSNATVLSAQVTLNLKASPSTNGTITLNTISSGNESWSESTVVCNNIPATVASAGTFTTNTAGEKVVTLNATGRSALQTALGSTTFSLRATAGALVTNHTYESADEGTSDNLGPRLDFVFTVPV